MPHARKEPAVEHIGIDLGAKVCHVVIVGAEGADILCRAVATRHLRAFLSKREPSLVVMETCTQSRAAARIALEVGHRVRVVPTQLVRALGVGARGIKTDARDARVLAHASQRMVDGLPGVHLRGDESVRTKELLAARRLLVSARSKLALSCKSWLRGRLLVIRGRATSSHFSQAFRRLARAHDLEIPLGTETLLASFEQHCEQIARLDAELDALVAVDPVVQRLMTMPGVGPVVAATFRAHIDDPLRFSSADQVGSYLALVPGEATTGGKIKRTATIRAGCRHVKSLLIQAAWSMWRSQPTSPLVLWAHSVEQRRGKRVAIVALARKMACILWAMWKHERGYEPGRATTFRPAADLRLAG